MTFKYNLPDLNLSFDELHWDLELWSFQLLVAYDAWKNGKPMKTECNWKIKSQRSESFSHSHTFNSPSLSDQLNNWKVLRALFLILLIFEAHPHLKKFSHIFESKILTNTVWPIQDEEFSVMLLNHSVTELLSEDTRVNRINSSNTRCLFRSPVRLALTDIGR